jgi:hypothetical protein
MSLQTQSYNARATAVNVPTTTPTTIVTTPVVNAGGGLAQNTQVNVSGTINLTPGTATTSVTVALQSNGVTTDIAVQTPVTAAVPVSIPFAFNDLSNNSLKLPGSTLSILLTQNAATGNGTVNAVNVEVDVLSN